MSEEFLGQSESDGPQSKRKKILIGSTVGLVANSTKPSRSLPCRSY